MYPGLYSQTQPDKAAAIRPTTGEILTYRQLDDRSNQLAQALHGAGLRRGDRVALYAENHMVFMDATWACLRGGYFLTPINRHLSAPEAAYIVENSDAKALIASAALEPTGELAKLTPDCPLKLVVGGSVPGYEDYEAALAVQPARKLENERLGGYMLYSSGTTGRPKGIYRPLADQGPELGNPQAKDRIERYGFDADTVFLAPAPLYHAAPLGYVAAVIQMGGTAVIMDKFDAETALQLIERHRVTHSLWVPTMFIRMLKLDPAVRGKYDLSSHRCAIHAAAPCPIEVKRQMIEWWGPIVEEYYSASEGVGLAAISSQEWLEHPGSVGQAKHRPFHICNEEGDELPPGVPGLIYGEAMRGPFNYHKDAEKTRSVTHPKHAGWMTVGDIGYLDEAGYLYLTDRKAFMIISGGVNIYPQQIEDALALHPKVADVAVFGVPNAELGEEVKAVVEPAAGVEPSPALAEEIMEFVRGKLGRQLTPRSVDFTDALPRLATGKLYKQALRDQYWGRSSPAAPLTART